MNRWGLWWTFFLVALWANGDPSNGEFEALDNQVEVLWNSGKTDEAAEFLEKMHEMRPDDLRVLEYLGMVYSNLPSDRPTFAKSLPWLLEAERRNSTSSGVYYSLGCIFSLRGETNLAEAYVEKAILLGDQEVSWWFKDPDLALLRQTGWWIGGEKAAETVREALQSYYDGVELHNKPDLEGASSDYRKAESGLESVFAKESVVMALPYRRLGEILRDQGDPLASLNFLQKALDLVSKAFGPEHPINAYIEGTMAEVLVTLERTEEALRMDSEALRVFINNWGPDDPSLAPVYHNLARAMAQIDEVDGAILNLQKADDLLKKEEPIRFSELAEVQLDLGVAYSTKELPEIASEFLRQALDSDAKDGSPAPRFTARILSKLGELRETCNDLDGALSALNQCLDLSRRSSEISELENAETLFRLGKILAAQGNLDEAMVKHEEALALRVKLTGPWGAGVDNSLGELATCYLAKGNFSKVFETLDQKLELIRHQEGPGSRREALFLVVKANIQVAMMRHSEALTALGEAIRIYDKIPDVKAQELLPVYTALAQTYLAQGDSGRALFALEKSQELRRSISGDPDLATLTSDDARGSMLLRIGRFDEGKQLLEVTLSGLELFIQGDSNDSARILRSRVLADLINANFLSGSVDRAMDLFRNLPPLPLENKQFGNIFETQNVAMSQMYTFVRSRLDGDLDQAGRSLESLINDNGIFLPVTIRAQLLGMASMFYADQDKVLSRSCFDQAIAAYERSESFRDILEGVWGLANGTLAAEDPMLASQAIAVGIDVTERARLSMGSDKNRILANGLVLYYAAVALAAKNANPGQAFHYSEGLRSRGFLDQLGQETALRIQEVSVLERERGQSLGNTISGLRTELERLNGLALNESERTKIITTGLSLQKAETELSDLNQELSKRIPRYGQLRNPLPIDVSQAQAWVGPHRAVLEYVLWDPTSDVSTIGEAKNASALTWTLLPSSSPILQPQSFCLLLTSSTVQIIPLGADCNPTELINEMRLGITVGRRPAVFEKACNTLYAQLVQPVLEHLPQDMEDLVIVPDGALAFLPFDLLRKSPRDRSLGEDYRISLSPSISVSVFQQENPTSDRSLLVGSVHYSSFPQGVVQESPVPAKVQFRWVAGDVDILSQVDRALAGKFAREMGPASYFRERAFQWSDLPGTSDEIHDIEMALSGGGNVDVLAGDEATETHLKDLSFSGQLARYNLLHFACHGHFDSLVPEMSCLVFSEVSNPNPQGGEDGFMTLGEVATLNLGAKMVTLSACETGLGRVVRGDGVLGLTRAFRVAGAKEIGVSLWKVDDAATAAFMAKVYSRVNDNGCSFLVAYQETKAEFRQSVAWSAPYYWAGFVLYQ